MNLQETNHQIAHYQRKVAEKTTLKGRLESTQSQLQQQQRELAELSARLAKEKKDVENLENFTLQSLWARLTNSTDERLSKERREATEVEWQYDQARRQLLLLQEDQNQLNQKLKIIEEAEQSVEQLLDLKLKFILEQPHPSAAELKSQYERNQKNQIQLTETSEAYDAAKDYFECVGVLIEQLRNARSWGTVDIVGGGVFSSMIKHQKLSNVRNSIQALKYHQHKLNRELQDIGQSLNKNLEISDFEHFADIFFDNIFTDLSVQKKIQNSLHEAENAHRQLHQLLMSLGDRKHELNAQVIQQEEYLRKLIAQAQ